ncbi:hypothetical protein N4T57_05410 [Campylobacter hepaticus]|uniref:Uncharacterized protein n=1 Tax=Campylobacter hepaticus TaxID=1813019 RepID=A0A6A7JRT1_9BACT|nr:hypothetical protein [Campylobacter hepaticus]AXP08726.1 hypothetical protein A2J15_003235 [Campylobacter hepaticus]MCZ0772574.1 hypothetical protein [Campylobacter hepaticus]MCZ0774042.1 hypothetical protein [Campylobacter hepaticus]MCZ0775294.1 hypothetical protein [Campylobacter hepaticus]MDX2323006.1 hypothetical protein [Campylobacter hepaticus]
MKTWRELSLNFLFKISDQPVLVRDLLEANALFNDGMLVDPSKLNFNFKILNSYIYFGLFCVLVLLPLLLITHYFLTKLDFHISIMSAVVVTACVFIGYDIFKVYVRKIISKQLIQKAWALHFPYFPYEKYSLMAGEFYKQALKEEIPKVNLEQYVLDKIIHSK